ncbi:MAG: hypothetical protein JWN92_2270 [Candidatus Acidoferrum typicum]|nr:hypothetical protein [Candidatus Acidoferrum typicum]
METSQMEMQHVNVKLLVRNPEEVDLEPLIPIFHGWIQNQVGEGLLLDIADYRHVDAGPGVVLIGHEGDYSVDNADHRLGVRYNRKAPVDGSNLDRLKQAARAALTACQRLEAESRLGGKLRFNGQEMEIFINDRLLAPNSSTTRQAFESDFESFFKQLFQGKNFSTAYASDPRKLFTVSVKTTQPFRVTDLLENLG